MSENKDNLLNKPAKLALNRLKKEQGLSSGKAALQLLESRSLAQQSSSNEGRQREKVDRNQMPFVPLQHHMTLTNTGAVPTSALTSEQQKRYVAIISNYLKPDVDFRFELNKFEIKGFDEMLVNEREFYQSECLKEIESDKNPYEYNAPSARKVYKERMTPRFSCIPEAGFQELVRTVYWPYDDKSTSGRQNRPVVEKNLTEGFVFPISIPNPRRKCQISNDPTPIRQKLFKNTTPEIETDETAIKFALDNQLGFIMCGSTLRSLLAMPWIYRDQNFAYKISVRQKLYDGYLRRFVIFSKPIVSSVLSKSALQHRFIKWVIKTLVRDEPKTAQKRKRKSSNFENSDIPDDKKSKLSVPMEIDASTNESVEVKNESNDDVQMEESVADSNLYDLLGDIIQQMDANVPTSACPDESELNSESKKRYSIIGLNTEYSTKQRILIRTSNHGVEGNGEKVCLTVKSDYLPGIGAESLHDEEIIWNFYTALLKSADTFVNIRVHPLTGHVLQVQRVDVKSMYGVHLTDAHRRIISQRSERLCTLLGHINELNPGEYLLKSSAEHLELLSDTIKNPMEKVWTSNELMESGLNAPILPVKKPSAMWNGLDKHLPLVWHIVKGRVPGSLPAKHPKFEDGFKPGVNFGNNKSFRGGRGANRGGNRGKRGHNKGRGKI